MLDISKALKNPGQSYPLEERVAIPPMEILGEAVTFDEGLLKGELLGAEDSVSVKGDIRVKLHAHCARCLEPVVYEAEAAVDEGFGKEEKLGPDSDLYPIKGDTIDLDEMAKDAVLLNLPMRFLCDEACKGLCPRCYTNRNKQKCNCLEGDDENPFSALKDLFN